MARRTTPSFRLIVVTSVLDVVAFTLPSLMLAAVITYTAWAWCMDIPVVR